MQCGFWELDYLNDAIDRRTCRLDNDAVTNVFGYNPRSELTAATMGMNEHLYAFDGIGNRTVATNNGAAKAYVTNPLNQYTSITNGYLLAPGYDLDGNMSFLPSTSGGGAGGEGWHLQWDAEHRLIAASNAEVRVEHLYDHQSRRVAKRIYEWDTDHWSLITDHAFLYDGWNLIRETVATQQSTTTNHYVWGLDLSGTLQGAGGIGGLLAVIRDGTSYFPCYDANGNITDYVSTNGTVVAHYEYDPFGNKTVQTGDLGEVFAFRFSTKHYDAETGLYYFGMRHYSARMGRFISLDPFAEMAGPNGFSLCSNDPVNESDLLGLLEWTRDGYCCSDSSGETRASIAAALGLSVEQLELINYRKV